MGFLKNIIAKLKGKVNGYCCKDCVSDLYSVLDGEAGQEEEKYFMDHINECRCCFDQYEIDKSVKELVKYKIDQKPVPSSLVESIKNKINKHS